jgi:hypothetical protein
MAFSPSRLAHTPLGSLRGVKKDGHALGEHVVDRGLLLSPGRRRVDPAAPAHVNDRRERPSGKEANCRPPSLSIGRYIGRCRVLAHRDIFLPRGIRVGLGALWTSTSLRHAGRYDDRVCDAARCRAAKCQGTKSREVGALANQRALSGFYAGAALDGKRDAGTRRRAMSAFRGTEESAVGHLGGRVKCSNGRLVN